MESDDEFGDLYADVLRPVSAAPDLLLALCRGGDDDDKEKDRIMFGPQGSGSRSGQSARPTSLPPRTLVPEAQEEDSRDDWLLGRASSAVETPANWDDEDDRALTRPAAVEEDMRSVFEEVSGIARGTKIAEAEGFGDADESGDSFMGSRVGDNLGDLDGAAIIPGLSASADPPGPFLGVGGGSMKPSESEDWDSDSEDDLQIVLNDSDHRPLGGERNDTIGMVYEDDEEDGEDDLVIVTGEDQHHRPIPAMEERDWGEDAMQPTTDGEKKETADMDKVTGAVGSIPGLKTGYGNHGFHAQHQSMYKYIRPGVSPLPAGPVAAALGSVDSVRPLAFGPIAGGRGDWRPAGVRGCPNALKNMSFGIAAWANSSAVRTFGGGLDFTLPAHKNVFDVDIESFEEKPWRHPGVDISNFFNFGLDEEKWKEYRKHLDQLRMESTMQSKICVYEGGQSKQEYDPDLPPELAAVTGHHISANGQGKADNGQADSNGQGRGAAIMWAPLPTGRAIQVEDNYSKRLPSIDTRPPRMRYSDAIIEIVLQDSVDDMTMSNGTLEQADKALQREHAGGVHETEEDDRSAALENKDSLPHTSHITKMEKLRRTPCAPGGDGILPFPSESIGDHECSRTRSPIHPGVASKAHLEVRSPQGSLNGRSFIAHEHSRDAIPDRSAHLDGPDIQQQEKLFNRIEVNQTSKMSPAVEDETVRHLSAEENYDEPDAMVALGDSIEIEEDNMISDFHKSSETISDDKIVHPGKKQKLCSQVEQPAVCISGDEDGLRTSHSENSGAKSRSSKDFQKQNENGEVTQGNFGQTTSFQRPHEREHKFQRTNDYGSDGREEIDKKQVAYKGREQTSHSYAQRNWDSVSAHSAQDRSFEKTKDTEASVGGRQRREDNLHNRRVKDEGVRRENSEEVVSRHRSKLMVSEKNQRNDVHSRKYKDGEEWRGHNTDEASRKRERDDISARHRENVDDAFIKRKNEEMRGKTDKEDAMHGYRAKEGSNNRREKDDARDHRRREDNNRTRDKIDAAKHKDDSWQHKEREESRRLKQPHESAPKHSEREEGRRAARNGQVIEDKPSSGNYRNKDGLKDVGYEKDYQDTDRRRQNEQSRRGNRARDENSLPHKGHGDLLACEKQFYLDERNSRHEKLSHSERHPSASDSQQKYRDRHRENTKKGKDTEVCEHNSHGLSKRKPENCSSHRNEKVTMTGSDEQERSNMRKDHQEIHEQQEAPQLHQVEDDLASDDENRQGSTRGRSKLERWTSHKERDYCSIDNIRMLYASSRAKENENVNADVVKVDKLTKTEDNKNAGMEDVNDSGTGLVDMTVEDMDLHLETMAKLKMRSERFKLPMPGERESTFNKKLEVEVQLSHSEAVTDTEVKLERPARKRKWTSS